MSEELLGPDVTCEITAPKGVRDSIQAIVSTGETELKAELLDRLKKQINESLEMLLDGNSYEHDGYSLSWESVYHDDFDGELHITTSFNVGVKQEDFDFFDNALNNSEVLEFFLTRILETLQDYLAENGVPPSDYKAKIRSDGFGYG